MTGNWVPAGHTPPVANETLALRAGHPLTPTQLLWWADQLAGLGPHTLIPQLAAALRRQIELTDRAMVLITSHRRVQGGQGATVGDDWCDTCRGVWPCQVGQWRRDVEATWEGT